MFQSRVNWSVDSWFMPTIKVNLRLRRKFTISRLVVGFPLTSRLALHGSWQQFPRPVRIIE